MADLKDLEDKIKAFKDRKKPETEDDATSAGSNPGMQAGSEFMAYIFSGVVVGWLIGHFFGNMALWLIVMIFLGFGLGIYRASQIMK